MKTRNERWGLGGDGLPAPTFAECVLYLLLALALILCGGCTHTSYTGAHGERFSRWQLGSLTAVGRLKITPQTNAPPIVELEGYNNDSLQAIGAVTEAAVRGAVKSVTP